MLIAIIICIASEQRCNVSDPEIAIDHLTAARIISHIAHQSSWSLHTKRMPTVPKIDQLS
jgi:hypothetical protein